MDPVPFTPSGTNPRDGLSVISSRWGRFALAVTACFASNRASMSPARIARGQKGFDIRTFE